MTFRFDNTDVDTWRKMAKEGGFTLSEWIRRRCNRVEVARPGVTAENENRVHEAVRKARGVGVAERGTSAPVGACEHRKREGELCYKCDAKFGRPTIGE